MSFTPKTWNTGDRVNASDMNRIEQGIADGGGGGYDAEIVLDIDGSTFSPSIVSGNYSTLTNLLSNNIAPNILVRVWVTNNTSLGNPRISTNIVAVYSQVTNVSVPWIRFFAGFPKPTGDWTGVYITWYADDTVVVS